MQVSRDKETTSGSTSLLNLKEAALLPLPISSTSRTLIPVEKDTLYAPDALVKDW